MFHRSSNQGSTTLTRDNGNGTKTEHTYANRDDMRIAERHQSEGREVYMPTPSIIRTVDKDDHTGGL